MRGRRGVEPTPAGEALLRRAREVVAAHDRLHAEIGQLGTGVRGSVRVMASPSVLAEALPGDVAGFLGRNPGVRVTLEERVSQDVVRNVREGLADLGVLWDQGHRSRATGRGLKTVPVRDLRAMALTG